jgi:molybdopterin-guanine dinucleotide biosynthesis adapter protein
MKVIGFAGYSDSGKTTLVERLIPVFRQQGFRVSVIKHAHHSFDIDMPGKDSWRHRQAGAFEVVVASKHRMALMREFERPAELTVHQLIAELYEGIDWVFVEGFKQSDLLKIEVWRAAARQPVQYPQDDFIVAVVTDSAQNLPPTALDVLDLDQVEGIADWMIKNSHRFEYQSEIYS